MRGRSAALCSVRSGELGLDILTYLVMFFVICPQMTGAGYRMLGNEGQLAFAALFQAGWFVESQWTQTFVVHSLRTRRYRSSRAVLPFRSFS